MNTSHNSYGFELPRAAATLLDEWVRGLSLGRLPPETAAVKNGGSTAVAVEVDGEPMTVRAFLAACRRAEPERVDAILHALDRRSSVVDASKPFLVPAKVARIGDHPASTAIFLAGLAAALRRAEGLPEMVEVQGEAMPLADALAVLVKDHRSPAGEAGRALWLDGDATVGAVAAALLERLTTDGVVKHVPKSTVHPALARFETPRVASR
jgi:hypothetical protein